MIELFLGHPISYWLELQRRMATPEGPRVEELLEEVVLLRGKLNFAINRVKELNLVLSGGSK